jgi:predicted RecB family endonuclease
MTPSGCETSHDTLLRARSMFGTREAHSTFKRSADQLGVEVIGMIWEVGVKSIC